MPLSWNEIRSRALAFSKEWADETSEDAEAKAFWDAFFAVFGITRRRVASFEEPVKKSDGAGGYIDLLWRGMMIVEHKSRGKDLDRATKQAFDYFPGLKERDLPRYVVVSDFARFRLHDLDAGTEHDFDLADLHKNVKLFGFMAGYQSRTFGKEAAVNIWAAEKLGKLHDLLKASGNRVGRRRAATVGSNSGAWNSGLVGSRAQHVGVDNLLNGQVRDTGIGGDLNLTVTSEVVTRTIWFAGTSIARAPGGHCP